ncbi:MAG: hpch/hpai aldolase, partial [Alphaproteobacteria bacterium]|nr:hpch/hpai aldolase [Alphaproteobacteria bacterium]
MPEMTLKEMTRSRDLKVGTMLVEFDTPGIGQIMKAAGIEFVFVDMEHSGFGYESLKRTLRYMQAADMPALVRVPSDRYDHIARALDIGAEGIMIPMVGSATQARHILNCMKYAPEGQRGVGLQLAHDRYAAGPVLQKLKDANDKTTFFALIETAEGADNADEIAAVPGVDCLWIGHFDLTCSLGIPGEFGNPRFRKA